MAEILKMEKVICPGAKHQAQVRNRLDGNTVEALVDITTDGTRRVSCPQLITVRYPDQVNMSYCRASLMGYPSPENLMDLVANQVEKGDPKYNTKTRNKMLEHITACIHKYPI